MANPQLIKGVKLEIQSALGAADTITGISNATEAVVTVSNSYSAGDLIVISGVVGMTRINDQVVRVKSATATDFVAEGFDTTDFGTYVSGGQAQKVTSLIAFDNVSQLDLPDASPDEIDNTTIHDDERVIDFGLDGAQKGTLSLIADPLSPAVVEVNNASAKNERRVFRGTLQSGYVVIFNAFATGGRGISGSPGSSATGSVALTMRGKLQWFAS